MAQERGVAVVAGGIFNSGILADLIGTPYYDYAEADDANKARVHRLSAVCESHGGGPARRGGGLRPPATADHHGAVRSKKS